MKNDEIIASIQQPPVDSVFFLERVADVPYPHPYCITPRHVAWASDHHGGMLTAHAIEEAEKHGARCDICAKQGDGILRYAEHEQMKVLMIAVPREYQRNLNACPGLHAYLLSIKEAATAAGITSFGFPALESSSIKRAAP